jgi:hypothetical protein
MIRYRTSLFAFVLAMLAGAGITRADTPSGFTPRVVPARDAPRASTAIPGLLRNLPQPEMLALVKSVASFRLTDAGPSMPTKLADGRMIALELTPAHLRVLLVADGARLAVLLDAGVVETVAVRQTILVPTREDLDRPREPRTAGIYLHVGDPVEVLETFGVPDVEGGPGPAARVRHVRAIDATGFVSASDTGKLFPSGGWREPNLLRCDERQRLYRLRRGVTLHAQPGGPAFATVKAEADDDYILAGLVTRRGRHALVCNVGYGVLAWVHARDIRTHPKEKPGPPAMLTWSPRPEPVAGPNEIVLPENTPLHDRPGGQVVGHLFLAMVKPIASAAPGDWVETRVATDLGDIPVWFQVPR